MTINIEGLVYENVFIIGTFILLLTYFIRFLNLKVFYRSESIFPEVFMAPRGLITILLFYKIPEVYNIPYFSKEVISFVILGSALLMMIGLWVSKGKTDKKLDDYESLDHNYHRGIESTFEQLNESYKDQSNQ
jgi:hypothetical protein